MKLVMRALMLLAVVRGTSASGADAATGAAASAVAVGKRHQLFLDDFLVEQMERVRRVVQRATKHPDNPVLVPDKPWEAKTALVFGSVERHPESGKLRLWYLTAYTPTGSGQKAAICQCLAESDDGVRWTKPNLGLIPDDSGSSENNIVVHTAIHSGYDEGLTPVRDPDPKDANRRYRGLFWASWNGYRGTYAAWSPDGIHWTAGQKALFTDTGDAGTILYDSIRSRWMFLARPLNNQLSRAVSFSTDFKSWTPLRVIFQADTNKRENFYNMAGFCYEGIYIGLVVIMWEEPGRYALEPHLAMSRDGESWTWVDRQNAFVPHGGRGSWEEFNTQMASGEPIRAGDQLCFYYSGRTYPHRPYYARNNPEMVPKPSGEARSAIGLATLRVDGFACLEDAGGGGWVTTRPLLPGGTTLHVNADCRGGELLVEVLGKSGQPVAGYSAAECRPIESDGIDIPVAWQGDRRQLLPGGEPVRLRVHLRNARLFSFWFD